MNKIKWRLYEWYRGVAIVYREGLQRRGYASIYRNAYHDGKVGWFIHHGSGSARRHIDKLNKDLGDKCHITQVELDEALANE